MNEKALKSLEVCRTSGTGTLVIKSAVANLVAMLFFFHLTTVHILIVDNCMTVQSSFE